MQEKEIYNAKKELAKLYLILKTENIEGVINIKKIYNNNYNIILLLIQKKISDTKGEDINNLIEEKSLKELVDYLKNSIDIIVSINVNKELEKYYNDTELNPAREYEILLQKEEQVNREHIAIEHQFRIQCEKYAHELDSAEEEKVALLLQIVSGIIIN